MIVRPRPSALGLLFTLRGSIIPMIAPRIAVVAAISAAVTVVHHVRPNLLPELSAVPLTLLGLGLSIFLGFRNSACYDRWWEARKQWGQLLTEVRSLARTMPALLPPDVELQRRAARRLVAFAHALAARLRGQDEAAAARPWLSPEEARHLGGRTNVPDAILRLATAELGECLRRDQVDAICMVVLEGHIAGLCGVQAACERIRATPTPFAYSLLLHRTAWLFCLLLPFALAGGMGVMAPVVSAILAYAFFGLDALGDELEEPFALQPNTLPLNAMVRLIEIEVLEGLGETDLPPMLGPVRSVLQ